MASLVIDALVDAGVVKKESFDKAATIAAEEIRVRITLGDLPKVESKTR